MRSMRCSGILTFCRLTVTIIRHITLQHFIDDVHSHRACSFFPFAKTQRFLGCTHQSSIASERVLSGRVVARRSVFRGAPLNTPHTHTTHLDITVSSSHPHTQRPAFAFAAFFVHLSNPHLINASPTFHQLAHTYTHTMFLCCIDFAYPLRSLHQHYR